MLKIKQLLVVMMLFFCTTICFAGDAKTPVIYNVTLTSADTEYSQQIVADAKKITVQCRTSYVTRLAYESGYVATPTSPYLTIKAGSVYWEDGLKARGTPLTIYLASSEAGVVLEIVAWR